MPGPREACLAPTSRGAGSFLEAGRLERRSERPREAHPAHVPDAAPRQHARRVVHLGHQHAVPARRRALEPRGVRGERVLHGRDDALRDPDRRRRRHRGAGARRTSSERSPSPASTLLYYFLWAARRALLVVGGRVDPPRARLHVLLGRDRGVARRRAAPRRLRRRSGGGARARPDGRRRGDARRLGRGRRDRAGDERSACRSCCGSVVLLVDVRRRVEADARPRLHAGAVDRARAGGTDTSSRTRSSTASRNPPVRWIMLAAPFTSGIGFYTFYALQPYLLELYGDPEAYAVAGLAAAIVAGAQIARRITRRRGSAARFQKRTTALILATLATCAVLVLLGLTSLFWLALALLVVWGHPLRGEHADPAGVPERHDPVAAARDGAVVRLAHGRAPAASSSSRCSAAPPTSTATGRRSSSARAIQLLAVPFLFLSRRERSQADTAVAGKASPEPEPTPATP